MIILPRIFIKCPQLKMTYGGRFPPSPMFSRVYPVLDLFKFGRDGKLNCQRTYAVLRIIYRNLD